MSASVTQAHLRLERQRPWAEPEPETMGHESLAAGWPWADYARYWRAVLAAGGVSQPDTPPPTAQPR